MIREYFEKRRTRRILGRYLSRDKVEAVLRGDPLDRRFTPAHIEFVLAFVYGETPEEVSDAVGKVTEIAIAHHAVVHDIVGALVVVAFGAGAGGPIAGDRASLVEHLGRALSNRVKLLHGAAEGHHGLVGSGARIAYSLVLPRFDAMLGRLSRLEFGQTEEFG